MTNHNFQVGDTVIFVNDGLGGMRETSMCMRFFGSRFKIISIVANLVNPECKYVLDLPIRMRLPASCLRYVPPGDDRIDHQQRFRDTLQPAPKSFAEIIEDAKRPLTEKAVRNIYTLDPNFKIDVRYE
jgi:hypothetical protein